MKMCKNAMRYEVRFYSSPWSTSKSVDFASSKRKATHLRAMIRREFPGSYPEIIAVPVNKDLFEEFLRYNGVIR
jgi:hypothetical protein